jgi:uncharacterized Fe-S cluster-containing protein
MGDSIKVKLCVVEPLKTDAKPGTVISFRTVDCGISVYAQLLMLSANNVPVTLAITPAEDLLTVDPAIDYSDVDAAFDPDFEEDAEDES